MVKCLCPSCTDTPDFRYSLQHMRECEARTVMGWPKDKRLEFYAGVKKKRGDKAMNDLIAEVKKQWKEKQ